MKRLLTLFALTIAAVAAFAQKGVVTLSTSIPEIETRGLQGNIIEIPVDIYSNVASYAMQFHVGLDDPTYAKAVFPVSATLHPEHCAKVTVNTTAAGDFMLQGSSSRLNPIYIWYGTYTLGDFTITATEDIPDGDYNLVFSNVRYTTNNGYTGEGFSVPFSVTNNLIAARGDVDRNNLFELSDLDAAVDMLLQRPAAPTVTERPEADLDRNRQLSITDITALIRQLNR